MSKLLYLTKNIHKVEEANRFFRDKYGFDLEIMSPDFEVLEIQADNCGDIAKFSAKYSAERLGIPVLKSDSGLYIDYLGGLPGPYNAYFDKQIGVEKFLFLMKDVEERGARLEHAFAFCEPGGEPIVFSGGSLGKISQEPRGTKGRWHDRFFVPNGETKTLSELREHDPDYEEKFWGTAKKDFAEWYVKNFLQKE